MLGLTEKYLLKFFPALLFGIFGAFLATIIIDEFEQDYKPRKSLHQAQQQAVAPSSGFMRQSYEIPQQQVVAQHIPQIPPSPQVIRRVFQAAIKGDLETLKSFIEQGCPATVVNENEVPLIYACAESGNCELVRYLVGYASQEQISQALHGAARFGQVECCQVLVEAGADLECTDKDGARPLHWAAQGGGYLAVKYLIEAGCNIEGLAKYDSTPLHIAARGGQEKVVQTLIQFGANIEAPTSYRYTPLHVATMKGHEKIVKILLEHRANVQALTNTGLLSLHIAAMQGLESIINLLLQHGSKVTVKDAKGKTAAQYAMEQGHTNVARMLQSYIQRQQQQQQQQQQQLQQQQPMMQNPQMMQSQFQMNQQQVVGGAGSGSFGVPQQTMGVQGGGNQMQYSSVQPIGMGGQSVAASGSTNTLSSPKPLSPRGGSNPSLPAVETKQEVKNSIPDGISIQWSKPRKLPPGITEADLQDLIGTEAAHPISLPTEQDFEKIKKTKETIPDGITVKWNKPKPPPEILAMLGGNTGASQAKGGRMSASMGSIPAQKVTASSNNSSSRSTPESSPSRASVKKSKKADPKTNSDGSVKKLTCPFCGNAFEDLQSHMTECVILKSD